MNKLTLQNIRHAFENAILLGKGTNGIAFKIVIGNKEYVLKLTSSFSEYQIALKIKKLQISLNNQEIFSIIIKFLVRIKI